MSSDKITINVEDLPAEPVSPEVPWVTINPVSLVPPPYVPKTELPKNNSRFVAAFVIVNFILTLILCVGVGYLVVSGFSKIDTVNQQECEPEQPSDVPMIQPAHVAPIPEARDAPAIVIPLLDETIEIQFDTNVYNPTNKNAAPFINHEMNPFPQ